jgi:hypothetical protein
MITPLAAKMTETTLRLKVLDTDSKDQNLTAELMNTLAKVLDEEYELTFHGFYGRGATLQAEGLLLSSVTDLYIEAQNEDAMSKALRTGIGEPFKTPQSIVPVPSLLFEDNLMGLLSLISMQISCLPPHIDFEAAAETLKLRAGRDVFQSIYTTSGLVICPEPLTFALNGAQRQERDADAVFIPVIPKTAHDAMKQEKNLDDIRVFLKRLFATRRQDPITVFIF